MGADSARQRYWRMILGGGEADGIGWTPSGDDALMDRALEMLYGNQGQEAEESANRRGGLGASSPTVARWLGDIRRFFPSSVVRVLQQDAMDRLGLKQLLLEPEVLETVEADVHLVASLVALKNVIPAKSKATARLVVQKVVDELLRRLEQPMRAAVLGTLNRALRNRRPRVREIDWARTIRANLKNYLPAHKTIVPETRIGFGRKRAALRDIVLCVDQSGSMASSVVYSGIFAAVLASMPAVNTRLVVFDTAVVDLTDELQADPVDLLFGVQLGGGTDINRALAYCQGLIARPEETIFVLISDLIEGGNRNEMLRRATEMVASGMQCIALLALSDDGAPSYDHNVATALAGFGIPAFACTPDQFPSLMAAAIAKRDLSVWAAQEGVVTSR